MFVQFDDTGAAVCELFSPIHEIQCPGERVQPAGILPFARLSGIYEQALQDTRRINTFDAVLGNIARSRRVFADNEAVSSCFQVTGLMTAQRNSANPSATVDGDMSWLAAID